MNVDEMQRKLSQKAAKNPEHHFENLYSLLCHSTWLREAHRAVSTNQGRETAGIDGQTMRHFNEDVEGNLQRLCDSLKAKTFEPVPVRRVYIPKANGTKRPLGIATIDDRIVQEALRMALEPIWEADFSPQSYGFRPNRSTYDAIAYIGNTLTARAGKSYQWVIEGDIASYFDTIPQRRLIKAVKKRVADKDIIHLVWMFLRAGVMYRDKKSPTLAGTPQGGVVSPLLANIYLHQFDRYMESNYLHFSEDQRYRRRKKGKSNFLYVRYADDFVVLCNGTKAQTKTTKEELKGFLKSMGLTLSEEKTKVTHITEGLYFLGYRIIRSIGTRGTMVPKVLIPEKALKSYLHTIRRILAPNTTHESLRAKIIACNWLTRGWCEYYRNTSAPAKIFGHAGHNLFWAMAHWLGKKYKLSMPKIMQRYRKGTTTFGTSTTILAMPSEYKAKRLLRKTWHNPYTNPEGVQAEKDRIKRESLVSYDHIWKGGEDRPGTMDLREELLLTKGTTCHQCKIQCDPWELQMDHIVARSRFKNPRDADRITNQQLLCTPCHRAKTKADLKVLSRVR